MSAPPFRLADSAFRGEKALNITHATDPTWNRTLCGRECSKWTTEAPTEDGPDCLVCRSVWETVRARPSVDRVVFVGEDNPYGGESFALYREPPQAAGYRLWKILGVTGEVYDDLTKVNLCSGGWNLRNARHRAANLLMDVNIEVLVLLGKKVQQAFGLVVEPFALITAPRRVQDGFVQLVVLPHPSGRCTVWNTTGAVEGARCLLREAVPEVAWGSAA